MTTTIDPPGTCHQVGCDGKGTKDEHVDPTAIVMPQRGTIGAGTWDDYAKPTQCLGFPTVVVFVHQLTAICSIGGIGGWKAHNLGARITPALMAELVDRHKTECPNRSARG